MPSSFAAHRVPLPLSERDAHKDGAADSAPPAATGVPDLAAFTTWEQHADGRRFGVLHFRLSGIYCAACSSTIESALTHVVGVADARVNAGTQRAWVRWDGALASPAQLVEAIERAGYGAAPDAAGSARVLRLRAQRRALWRLFVAVFCMMQVMMYSTPLYVAEPGSLAPDLQRLLQWASWLLSVPVLLFSAGPFFTEAWRSLRMRRIGMDVPVALGIGVMFAVSSGATFDPGGLFGHEVYFDSLTMFVSFLLGGRYLELKARNRVAASLEGAVSRLPMLARRLAGSGAAQMVAQAELRVGDRLRVLRGEAFPADGSLVDGATEADEALLTGESAPVPKARGDAVLAGSLNLAAPVSMQVERLGADTRYEGIVALMRGALTQRPQVLRAADRIAGPFLWGVLLLALGAGAVWSQVEPARAVWVMVSVLIVTCPCALSLAAPSALLAAAGALARRGVLVQRLDALEGLAAVDAVIFDKTGTLTDAMSQLARVEPLPAAVARGLDAGGLQALAASLAASSSHPLARALCRASEAAVIDWTDVQDVPGSGLQAARNGQRHRLGSRAWVDGVVEAGPRGDPADGAASEVWFGAGGAALARFEFTEALRADAAEAVAALQAAGLGVALLSGDAPARVAALAQRLHMTDAQGGATPETKLARIARDQGAGRRVAMVGDGLNDAPVIARADVSFAMIEGADVTRSKADFILMSGRLADVAMARRVAQRAMRIVRQNLGWAVAYNAVCVPLALLGAFPPWAAGLGMATSSLAVVLNALRAGAPLPRA